MRSASAIGVLLVLISSVPSLAVRSEMTLTDAETGSVITVTEKVSPESATDLLSLTHGGSRAGLIWEASAGGAICESVGISDTTYHSFIGWHLNDQAWAFFDDTVNVPVWEYGLGDVDDLPHDITSDGTCMAGGAGNTLYGFGPSSSVPDWVYPIGVPTDEVYNLLLSDDAQTIYYASGDVYNHMNITSVDLTTFTENWSYALPEGGRVWGAALSRNGEVLVIVQYSWVTVYSSGGDVLFQIERATGSQATPAVSDDGSIFVIGDLHGYVDVYEYRTGGTYQVKWQYLVPWGTYYDWATALAVSGDGGTIAAGSYQTDGGGQTSGEVAVFDVGSNVPLWVFSSADDMIVRVDISEDGSVIAAASWGPLEDGADDLWVFRRDSNRPFLTYDCTGSPFDLDMSSDGARCIVGGKAVHARIMGSGGRLYCFDSTDPTGIDDPEIHVPGACVLLQNRPNPLNPLTTLTYFLAAPGHVRLAIYDVEGRLVATVVDDSEPRGRGSAVWNGRDGSGEAVASGVYFARLESGGGVDTRKITLIR
jgi:hypothetical protein